MKIIPLFRRRFCRTRVLGAPLAWLLAGALLASASVLAQGAMPYGSPVTLAQAKKVAAAAEAFALKNAWPVVIAIVDTGGHLVLLQRLDSTQYGSVDVAQQKARSSAAFKRSTKAFQDVLAGGGDGLRILRVEAAAPLEGGLPLIADGRIIGAIGISGVTSQQDGLIAKAGADALAAP